LFISHNFERGRERKRTLGAREEEGRISRGRSLIGA